MDLHATVWYQTSALSAGIMAEVCIFFKELKIETKFHAFEPGISGTTDRLVITPDVNQAHYLSGAMV